MNANYPLCGALSRRFWQKEALATTEADVLRHPDSVCRLRAEWDEDMLRLQREFGWPNDLALGVPLPGSWVACYRDLAPST